MPPPAISVLMSVFNAAPFVAEAVDSVVKQTFGDFELLIVDDGSTDDSGAIIAALAAQERLWRVPPGDWEIKSHLLLGPPLCHPSVMLRASAMRENRLAYNEDYLSAEDYLFSWARLRNGPA